MAEVPEDYDSGPDEDLVESEERQPEPPLAEDGAPQLPGDRDAPPTKPEAEEAEEGAPPPTQAPEEAVGDMEVELVEDLKQWMEDTREPGDADDQALRDLEPSVEEVRVPGEMERNLSQELASPETAAPKTTEMSGKLFGNEELPAEEAREPADIDEEELSKDWDVPVSETPRPRDSLKDMEPSAEMEGEREEDLELLVGDSQEEPAPESPSKAAEALAESPQYRELEAGKEAEPKVVEATINETELVPLEQSSSKFLSETPRQSVGVVDLQPTEMAMPEVPEETQRKSLEEEKELSEQATPATPEERPTGATGEELEIPGETHRESTEEDMPKLHISSEVPEEKWREPTEQTDLKPLIKITPEVEQETERKLSAEKVPKPPEDTESEDQKEDQRQSLEEARLPSLPPPPPPPPPLPPQKLEAEETLRKSTEKKGLEPLEQAQAEFSMKQRRTSSEKTSQLPQQKIKAEIEQREFLIQSEPSVEDRELPDSAKSVQKTDIDTRIQLAKDDKPEPLRLLHSIGDKVQLPSHQGMSVREAEKMTGSSMLGYFTGSQVDTVPPVRVLYGKEPYRSEILYPSNHLKFSKLQRDLGEVMKETEDGVLTPELKKLESEDEEEELSESTELQFEFLSWSPEDVAEWIGQLGFPQYKECFTTNFISGRKLIHVNCSNLPQMGITDFKDMKVISRHTRKLLKFKEPLFSRSISLPYRDNVGLFLERKGHTGLKSDALTFSEFVAAAGLEEES